MRKDILIALTLTLILVTGCTHQTVTEDRLPDDIPIYNDSNARYAGGGDESPEDESTSDIVLDEEEKEHIAEKFAQALNVNFQEINDGISSYLVSETSDWYIEIHHSQRGDVDAVLVTAPAAYQEMISLWQDCLKIRWGAELAQEDIMTLSEVAGSLQHNGQIMELQIQEHYLVFTRDDNQISMVC